VHRTLHVHVCVVSPGWFAESQIFEYDIIVFVYKLLERKKDVSGDDWWLDDRCHLFAKQDSTAVEQAAVMD
jgi:hypothetical protein